MYVDPADVESAAVLAALRAADACGNFLRSPGTHEAPTVVLWEVVTRVPPGWVQR